jgi:SEC-C motif
MPGSLLTADDLDEISAASFDADDPMTVLADLVDAVEHGRVADKADIGYALILAAEIANRVEELETALALADRAIEAHRLHGSAEYGYPRTFRAGLLLRLGREDEGLAELTRLRPLVTQDPDAVAYVTGALEVAGRAEIAEQWLSAALETVLARQALEADHGITAYRRAAPLVYLLAQERHRIRRELDLPYDEHDDLADELCDAVAGVLAEEYDDDDDGEPAVLFWPRVEHDQLLARWPALARWYGSTWDEHRRMLERDLQARARSGAGAPSVLTGSAGDLARYAARAGGDAADEEVIEGYIQDLPERSWPPGRNEPCWCGSGLKYKKCCLARSRA